MFRTLLFSFSICSLLSAQCFADSAAEVAQAWLAFANARGEPSLIRGDLEHPSVNSIFRNIPDVSEQGLDARKLELGFELFNETS